MQNEKISFIASLPDILSAFNVSGVDGNSRVKLDIPASEINAIIQLTELKGQAFKVTIEKIKTDNDFYNNTNIENLME